MIPPPNSRYFLKRKWDLPHGKRVFFSLRFVKNTKFLRDFFPQLGKHNTFCRNHLAGLACFNTLCYGPLAQPHRYLHKRRDEHHRHERARRPQLDGAHSPQAEQAGRSFYLSARILRLHGPGPRTRAAVPELKGMRLIFYPVPRIAYKKEASRPLFLQDPFFFFTFRPSQWISADTRKLTMLP